MPLDMLRSPAVVETLLLAMLFAWLGGSALMLLLADSAARRYAARQARLAEGQTEAALPR